MGRSSQSGSHLIAFAVAVMVIGVVAFSGYKVWQMQQKPADTGTTATVITTKTAIPQTIKTSTDLTQASKALDSSANDVNSSLNDSALNADLNTML